MPLKANVANLLRSLGGDHLDHIQCIDGKMKPCARPCSILSIIKITGPPYAAIGVNKLRKEQIPIPAPKKIRPPCLVVRKPAGS